MQSEIDAPVEPGSGLHRAINQYIKEEPTDDKKSEDDKGGDDNKAKDPPPAPKAEENNDTNLPESKLELILSGIDIALGR